MEERINKLGEHFLGIDRYNDALIVKVKFPSNWHTFPSEEKNIKVTASGESDGIWFYYGNHKDCTLTDIFDLIEATMTSNKDMLLKIELLKTKINELKEEFEHRDYKELVNLQFIFPKPKKTKKAKKSNTKEETIGTPLTEDVSNNSGEDAKPSNIFDRDSFDNVEIIR